MVVVVVVVEGAAVVVDPDSRIKESCTRLQVFLNLLSTTHKRM